MKNNNKILYISIAILVLAIGIAFGTYAYYQTTISGTISGNVAKWSFKANGETSSFNLDLGNLYPGVSNTYNIELSAEDSDLDVYYEVFIEGSFSYETRYNLLYWDSSYTIPIQYCKTKGKYGIISAGEDVIITLYFNWPYGTAAEYYSSDRFNDLSIHIVGQQLTGYTGTTPMHIFDDQFNIGRYENGYIYETCAA